MGYHAEAELCAFEVIKPKRYVKYSSSAISQYWGVMLKCSGITDIILPRIGSLTTGLLRSAESLMEQ